MRTRRSLYAVAAVVAVLALVAAVVVLRARLYPPIAARFVDPARETIRLHWRDARGEPLLNLPALRRDEQARGRTVLFAMNGGMYTPLGTPVGLYVEDGVTVSPLDTATRGEGNFYLMPNGVFGVEGDGRAFVCTTAEYGARRDVRYATQSGPMLVVHGRINPAFQRFSSNLNVRNGVGVRPDGTVVFAISRERVNFHAFASYFVRKGCTDALYFDGHVSRAYIPEEGYDERDGRLGVMVSVSARGGQ